MQTANASDRVRMRLETRSRTAYGAFVGRSVVAAAALAALVSSAPAIAAADDGWQKVRDKDGITLEKRSVEGSRFLDYRARTHTTVSPDAAVKKIWGGIGDEKSPTIKRRAVVQRSVDEVVVYDQIRAPVVTDRDVIIRIRKITDAHTGGYEIQFQSTTELGPPPAEGYVRLPMVRGGWRIEPDGAGGSNVAYTCYSEPGGAVPAFMVRGTQQDNVLEEFERVMTRVGR
ncbi:MAG: hypothetical protein JWN44_1122 [Myxococcales bacterium]|nr:hypothetical protein [Myxococcales bacterium]